MFDIKKIEPEEFLQILQNREQYQIVDVNEEQDNFCFRLNLQHIPFSELEQQVSFLDKDMPLVLVCRYGERSFFGASVLQKDHGFKNVLSLTGGTKIIADLLDMDNENVKSK
jgi:rhodanese-related sulfurtransferase